MPSVPPKLSPQAVSAALSHLNLATTKNSDEPSSALIPDTTKNIAGCFKGVLPLLPTLPQSDLLPCNQPNDLVFKYTSFEYCHGDASNKHLKEFPYLLQNPKVCEHWVKLNSRDGKFGLRNVDLTLANLTNLDGIAKTEQFYIALVSSLPEFLQHTPEEFLTFEVVHAALISKNGFIDSLIKYIPDAQLSENLILSVLECKPEILYEVPEKFKNGDFYLEAIRRNPLALYYVPEENKTLTVCMAAVQQNGLALKFVPDNLKSQEIRDAACQQNEKAFLYFPRNKWDKKEWQRAVDMEPALIFKVPHQFLDKDLVVFAAQSLDSFFYGSTWEELPKLYVTPEVCKAAVSKNPKQIFNVPKEYLTPDLYVAAFCAFDSRPGQRPGDSNSFYVNLKNHFNILSYEVSGYDQLPQVLEAFEKVWEERPD